MKVTADTNVLLRIFAQDDAAQSDAATEALEKADAVAVGLVALCEFAWVLTQRYGAARAVVAEAIRDLTETRNVSVDRVGVEAGLSALAAGCDFADGVIAYQGRLLGGETFISFDRTAVRAMTGQGQLGLLLK